MFKKHEDTKQPEKVDIFFGSKYQKEEEGYSAFKKFCENKKVSYQMNTQRYNSVISGASYPCLPTRC